MFIDGDLIPSTSGQSSLGVDSTGNSAFDISSIKPFSHIHLVSGVWHDPLYGQSGVIRFNQQAGTFQVSVNGGLTFQDISTGAGGITSIGVIGDVNLTGAVDLATLASGFMTITDTADASPLVFAVDNLGLSGLWKFPTQGFNGRVVNALTDSNGTEAQGIINVVGASGIYVDIIGQTMTITPGNVIGRAITQTFSSVNTVTVVHNFSTASTIVQVRDANELVIIPDSIDASNTNQVVVNFNTSRSGRIIVIGF